VRKQSGQIASAGDQVALSDLVERQAFAGPSRQAQERNARRWIESLSTAARSKRGNRWYVNNSAVLPSGSTVLAFVRCGDGGEKYQGYRLPSTAKDWTEKQRQRFLDTHELIRRFDAFGASRRRVAAKDLATPFALAHGDWAKAKGLKCDLRTLRRYRDRLTPGSPRFDGNVDGRGSKNATKPERICSPEAWKLFLGLVCHENQHHISTAYRFVHGEARRNEWAWPSLSWCRKRLREEIPEPVMVLARKGERKFEAQCVPKIQRDYTEILAGEHWCLDGRTLDIMTRVPDARNGWRRARLVVTGVLDMRSRKMVGWDIREHENADGVAAGIKNAIEECGLPSDVTIDCGTAYKRSVGIKRSKKRKWVADPKVLGMFSLFDVNVHQSLPYQAWSKQIESIWNRFKEGFDRWSGKAFWGGKPEERPPGADAWTRKRVDQLWTADEVRSAFGDFLIEYHATPQGGDGAYGLTPNLIYEQFRAPVRQVATDFLDLAFARLEGPVKVTKNGIKYKNVYYGQKEPELWSLQGQEVLLRIDPARADVVVACNLAGKPLCVATQERLSGCTQEDMREAARTKARYRKIIKQICPASDFLANTSTSQILDLKRQHAEAIEADLRKQLPAAEEPERITVVAPELAEAAEKLRMPRRSATRAPGNSDAFNRFVAGCGVPDGDRTGHGPRSVLGALDRMGLGNNALAEPDGAAMDEEGMDARDIWKRAGRAVSESA